MYGVSGRRLKGGNDNKSTGRATDPISPFNSNFVKPAVLTNFSLMLIVDAIAILSKYYV